MKRFFLLLLIIHLQVAILSGQNCRLWKDGALLQSDFVEIKRDLSIGELKWGISLEKATARSGNLRVHYHTSATYMDPSRSWVSPNGWNEPTREYLQTGFDWLELNRRKAQHVFYTDPSVDFYKLKSELRTAMETYRRNCDSGNNLTAVSSYRQIVDEQMGLYADDMDSLFVLAKRISQVPSSFGFFAGFRSDWSRVFPPGMTYIPFLAFGADWQYKKICLEFEAMFNFGHINSPNVSYRDSELSYDWEKDKPFGATGWCFRGGYRVCDGNFMVIIPFAGLKKENLFQRTIIPNEKGDGMASSWIEGIGGQVGCAFRFNLRRDCFLSIKANSLYETDITISLFGDRLQYKGAGSSWSINLGLLINVFEHLSF
ncbi:MAG: hypothetical protein II851_05410 [Bacteroidales bacterium]|nr:hypothetical protein [Bacteroidales bacterium]